MNQLCMFRIKRVNATSFLLHGRNRNSFWVLSLFSFAWIPAYPPPLSESSFFTSTPYEGAIKICLPVLSVYANRQLENRWTDFHQMSVGVIQQCSITARYTYRRVCGHVYLAGARVVKYLVRAKNVWDRSCTSNCSVHFSLLFVFNRSYGFRNNSGDWVLRCAYIL